MSKPANPAWQGLLDGCRRTLALALTTIENDSPQVPELLAAMAGHGRSGRVVGFTGAPGTGKSTLVGTLIPRLRSERLKVGIIAVDPSSPRTGGAVLGDRLRMHSQGDPGVFVRSVAARGHLGGLSLNTARMIEVMIASGKDVVMVETVGTGQSEIEVASLADVSVVVLAPGLGDGIQAMKAGILEIADLLVVNKCDRPGADRCENDLRLALALRQDGECGIRILKTSATRGDGLDALAAALLDSPRTASCPGSRRIGALVIDEACRRLRAELARHPDLPELCARVLAGSESLEAAARALLVGRPSR